MEWDTPSVVNIVVEITIGVTAMAGNGLVMYILCRHRRLRTVTNYFVLNLALADFMLGLLGVPSVVVTLFGMPHHFEGCLLANSTIIILALASVFGLLAVTVERFIAIRHPFFYHEKFTPKVVLIVSLFNWGLAILIGIIPLMGWNLGWNEDEFCSFIQIMDMRYHVYMHFFAFILPTMLACVVVYCYIFYVVLLHQRQTLALVPQYAAYPSDGAANPSVSGSAVGDNMAEGAEEEAKRQKKFRDDIKAAKKFALIVGSFAVCWLPLEVMNCVAMWWGQVCGPCIVVGVWLSHLNSAVNPVLYAYSNSAIMTAIKKELRCGGNQVGDNTESTSLN